MLLRADMLGYRLIDVENARLIRAAIWDWPRAAGTWSWPGVDTGRRSRRLFGLLGPETQSDSVVVRDWYDFEWLIGHAGSAVLRSPIRPHPEAEAGPDRRPAENAKRAKVLTLMGFNSTSAGGLMGMDFIALPSMASVNDALARVRDSDLLVITVDDVLEVTRPEDWRRREAAEPPDTRHGDAP